jgi:predicted outer membrane repeat protein
VNEGGGTYCRSEHGALFQDCLWSGNSAVNGAGMFHAEASTAHVEDCTFSDNVAGNGGGGIFCERTMTVVENCLFENNAAGLEVTTGGGGGGGSGGGGFWSTGGTPFVAECLFRSNFASFGGGVYHIEESAAVVVDCDFENNRAGEGGGLYTLSSPSHASGCTFIGNVASGTSFSVGGGMSNYFSDSVVEDCLFRGNHAELGGGGMYCEGENPLFTNLRFEGNEAFGDTEGFGGGLLDGYHTHSTIVNCTFALNRAKKGGAIHEMFASAGTIVNCSFADNRAIKGGTLFINDDSVSTYTNCVVWGSTPTDHVGPIHFEYGCMSDIGPGMTGSLSIDPLFVRMPSIGPDGVWGTDDDDFGDLHLQLESPCIDAGANRAVPAAVTEDADGAPRFHDMPQTKDTGVGASPLVDMGAFEVN